MKRLLLISAAVVTAVFAFAEAPLKVGVYGDAGPSGMGAVDLMRWIDWSPEMELVVLTGEDVRNDALGAVDLVVLPGGSGSAYDSLGETGRAKFVAYLRNGGRCLATGSGAALLAMPTDGADKCLGVIPYKSVGSLDHRLSLAPSVTTAGAAALGVPTGYDRTLRYDGGPFLKAQSGGVEGASFTTWATYHSEINLTGRVSPNMFGSVAIAGGTLESGKIVVFTHEPQYEYSKNSFIAGAITWLTGRAVTIPQHAHARGAIHVGLASDGITLASIAPFVRALDADSRFDLRPFDAIGARFELLEHLDALVFPDGSDHAELVAGGISRALVTETAAAGVKAFVWGSGANVLPLADAVTCTGAADALEKLRAAFAPENDTATWTKPVKVESPLRVTIFGDNGPCGSNAHAWYRLINDSPEMTVTVASGYQIRNTDILDRTDLFLVPGGTSSSIPGTDSLAWSGMNKLRDWIRNGGRYFGTCCGCALLLQQEYYLSIAPFKRIGSVPTDWGGSYGVDFSEEAAATLGMTAGCHQYRYAEGPIMEAGDPVEGCTIRSWGTYCGEGQYHSVCNGSAAKQYGATAMIAGDYGQGKVFAIALHPEAFRSTHEVIVKGFKWLTGRDITLPKRVRKPGAVRVAVTASNQKAYLYKTSPLVLALDADPAFEVTLADTTTLGIEAFQHVDAVILANGPTYTLDNPATLNGGCMAQFVANGGTCFGWGTANATAASFGSQGHPCDSAEDVYRALRETYQVTSEPSIHLHDWTYETNSVLSCTTPEIVVKTCHAEDCPTPVVTNTTAALGHDFTDWIVVTPSTATTRGLARRTCRRAGCDAVEEKVLQKTDETWYKVGVDPYNYSSWTKSYNATYGWAETAGGKVDANHAVNPEVHYVVPEGARLRTPFSGKSHTFAGKSLTLAGTLALNDTAGNSTKTITIDALAVEGQAAVITVGNPKPAWTVAGSLEIASGRRLTFNMFAESGSLYSVNLAAALSGAGELAVNGNPATYAGYRSALTLGDAANFTGTILTTNSRDMRCSLTVTGGFGGTVTSLPDGTASVVFNYDGLDAAKGLPVATAEVPSALMDCLTLYSATADFARDRLVLMTFPAGTELDPAAFTVNHAESATGAKTAFTRLHVQTAADGSVQLVANFCDHKWGDWSDTLEPTFLKEGARRRVCSVCGATSSEPTARLPVPSGYKAALYVEGKEEQYIYTGITIQDRITADLTFVFTKVGRISYMLGAWDKTGSNMREYLCNINASNTWRGSIANEGLTEFTDLPKAKVGATNHTVTVVNGPEFSFTLNGQTATKTYSTSVTSRNRELVLMAYNEAGSVLCKSDAKLFEAKIYTNLTVLARHYLPVYQESSQTYGLWDTVNGTFKKSSGSAFLGELAPPESPTINGEPVEPGKVFERATSVKPIVYPSAVTLTGEPGSQTVVFGTTGTAVPAYYTASVGADGKTVTLALNGNAAPVLAQDDSTDPPTEPFVFEGGTVRIHVGNAIPSLYYALGFAAALDGVWQTNDYRKGEADFTDTPPADAAERFYRVFATDAPEGK